MPTSLSQVGLYLCPVPAGGCVRSLGSGGGDLGRAQPHATRAVKGHAEVCLVALGVLQSVHVG